jgi:hypothetical protein
MVISKLAWELHEAISVVAPIDGVSIGDPENRATWSINFKAEATSDQITAAQTVLAGFVEPVEVVAQKPPFSANYKKAVESKDKFWKGSEQLYS